MDDKFLINTYCSTDQFPFIDLFQNGAPAWSVFSSIEEYIKKQFDEGKLKSNYKDLEYVYVGEGTEIKNGVEITGPAIIGKNCIIGPHAFIRENCIIGDNNKIGHCTEVKNSILFNSIAAGHFNYIADSIIGNNVNLSAGAVTANLRLDKKTVLIKHDNVSHETNLLKFGAVIGDNSMIGVHAVLNPGTILGKNSIVYPLVSVRGVHEAGEAIK